MVADDVAAEEVEAEAEAEAGAAGDEEEGGGVKNSAKNSSDAAAETAEIGARVCMDGTGDVDTASSGATLLDVAVMRDEVDFEEDE